MLHRLGRIKKRINQRLNFLQAWQARGLWIVVTRQSRATTACKQTVNKKP
jgi:hypothetical protein